MAKQQCFPSNMVGVLFLPIKFQNNCSSRSEHEHEQIVSSLPPHRSADVGKRANYRNLVSSVRVIISHANDFFSHAKNRLSHADRMRKLRFVLKTFTCESACERPWYFEIRMRIACDSLFFAHEPRNLDAIANACGSHANYI